jgi:uncharacterized protein YbjT (DUF2867 family)
MAVSPHPLYAAESGKRVLVGGATGRQGTAVVDELLRRGYAVRALTRNPSSERAAQLADRGIEVVQGDYADPASLASALEGIDRFFYYSGFSMKEVDEGANVITAAKSAGVRHLVYSSGAAAEPGVGMAGAAKMQVEEAIVASGVPYTVLRPVAFMENFDGQQKRFATMGLVDSRAPDRELTFIAIRDIGFLVGEAFDHPDEWLGKAINIGSDSMTVTECAATFTEVMGRDVPYNRMPVEEYLETMPKPIRPLFRWYEEHGYKADVAGLRSRYPNLLTLESYLRATGWENWQE